VSESLEATLRRLAEEREAADRRYNEGLTALDGARPAVPTLPDPVQPLDGARLADLNAGWNIIPGEPDGAGLKGRLAGFIWRTIGPYLQRQLAFNSVLVDHVNRNVEAQLRAQRQAEDLTRELRAFSNQVGALHTRLMMYLQQITAYVDTRDREAAGGALVLNAALSDLAETFGKYRESLQVREARYEARTSAIASAHEELRGMLAVAQQAITSMRRHLEGGSVGPWVPGSVGPQVPGSVGPQVPGSVGPQVPGSVGPQVPGSVGPQVPGSVGPQVPGSVGPQVPGSVGPGPRSTAADAFSPALDAYKYVGFEDQFRGSRDAIGTRQEFYLPFFADAGGDVLDVGCGRGEFIELLNARGIPARGIDLNHEMAENCRARGLNVVEADAVGYLRSIDDSSLGGVFAAQVVEHLEPSYLLRFLDLAFAKLRPGGTLVLETLNPACWTAFFESYIRDITHRWPLHPETLQYLVSASGFTRADLHFLSPVPVADRLQSIAVGADATAELRDLVDTFNANADKLNARIFSHMDYAVAGKKG
jgi:SAM-dependent methyltransferase